MGELRGKAEYQEGLHFAVNLVSGCWEWQLATNNGYGSGMAHRCMYEASVGPIPVGHDLHHVCRNRCCINPAHLEPVERVAHREQHQQEDSPLTAEQVIEIRERAAEGGSLVDLAREYGLHASAVKDIVWGRRWKNVGGPLGRPTAYCATCGAELEGMRHKKYCGYACRKQAEYAAKRARRKAAI